MSEKILLVDEQLFMLRLIQHHLEKAGYELIKARNNEEARTAMEQEKPKLVVWGAKAVETGIHPVLSELKQKENLPPIPVICLSDIPPTMAVAKTSKSEIVFTRPFSPTQLMAEVKRLIPQPDPNKKEATA